MTVGKRASGAGLRHVQIIPLDSNGFPFVASASATAEQGYQLNLARAFTPSFPDPTIVQHPGDDRVGGVTMLPATEVAGFELRTGMTNLEVDAELSNVNVFVIGNMQAQVMRTDQQGLEAEVGLLVYRKATVTDKSSDDYGKTRWVWFIIPRAQIVPQAGAAESGGDDENTYTGTCMVVNKHLWGVAFAEGTEGCTEGELVRGIAQGPPALAAWLGDNTIHEFTLPSTARNATDAIKVWHYSATSSTVTDVTDTVSLTTTAIDFGAGSEPEEDDVIIAFYEEAT